MTTYLEKKRIQLKFVAVVLKEEGKQQCLKNLHHYHHVFAVDINPDTNPDLVADGQKLEQIPNGRFNRRRCDPPYNSSTAKEMYGTDLPNTTKLLNAGARVCRPGSLMFILLGPKNYQICPNGVKRIGMLTSQ